jgi:hypothetical protein
MILTQLIRTTIHSRLLFFYVVMEIKKYFPAKGYSWLLIGLDKEVTQRSQCLFLSGERSPQDLMPELQVKIGSHKTGGHLIQA